MEHFKVVLILPRRLAQALLVGLLAIAGGHPAVRGLLESFQDVGLVEAGQMLRMPPEQVEAMALAGEIPGVLMPSGEWRFTLRAVKAYLAQRAEP